MGYSYRCSLPGFSPRLAKKTLWSRRGGLMSLKSCFLLRVTVSQKQCSHIRLAEHLFLVCWSVLEKGTRRVDHLDETMSRATSCNGCKTSTKHPMETPSPLPRLASHFCGDIC
jgi:hypothetical protein